MAEEDDLAWLRRIFSIEAHLRNRATGVEWVVDGPSLLMQFATSLEEQEEFFADRGCISENSLVMLSYDVTTAGVYKLTQLPKQRANLPLYPLVLPEDGNIPAIKKEFQSCRKNYFYVPLSLRPDPYFAGNYKQKTGTRLERHANGIIVNKGDGTYFHLEPQYSSDSPADDPVIRKGIQNAVGEIGAIQFSRKELNETCPQHLTEDRNCLFWTAYTIREILRNIYKNKDPNDTIKDISSRGKEELNRQIRLFKESIANLVPKLLSKANVEWLEYEENKPKAPAEGGAYLPPKYFRGLSTRKARQRKKELTRRAKMSFKNPKAYKPFKTDKGVKTRRSSYTQRFHAKYPDAKTLPEIAKATGISKSILQTVYDRGMAAWRTGHRPGASQHAWGMARVHSFVMKGKTWRTADADLARKV